MAALFDHPTPVTLRTLTLSLGLGVLVLAGCKGSTAGGDASLDDIATGTATEQLAYDAGFGMGEQQDSTFSFDRFRDGFNAGLDGDSAEVAYAMGLQIGLQVRADTVARINPDLFLASFREGLTRGERRLTNTQVARARQVFQDSLQMIQIRQNAALDSTARAILTGAERGRAQSDSLFRALRGRRGVQTTPSGVAYVVKRQGQGASPTEEDRVRVTYTGRLPNGTIFDQSPAGEPAEFAVGGVVPGFAEMLMQMKPGESRTVYLPAEMAYGLMGNPSEDGVGVPPSTAIVFDLTLVDVLAGMPQMGFSPEMMQQMMQQQMQQGGQ